MRGHHRDAELRHGPDDCHNHWLDEQAEDEAAAAGSEGGLVEVGVVAGFDVVVVVVVCVVGVCSRSAAAVAVVVIAV